MTNAPAPKRWSSQLPHCSDAKPTKTVSETDSERRRRLQHAIELQRQDLLARRRRRDHIRVAHGHALGRCGQTFHRLCVRLQLVLETADADAEQLGCLGSVALRALQRAEDVPALHFTQRQTRLEL